MTERENFLRMFDGEIPEWIPRYYTAQRQVMPGFMMANRTPEGGKDIFGVPYVATKETGNMALPVPNQFILDDITKWRDVIKVPDLEQFDWEEMAKKDLSTFDRNELAVNFGTGAGVFMNLMNFMGFTEGLCAMLEEPEEVKELFEYLGDFYVKLAKKGIEYYHPDLMGIGDDIAAVDDPFVSMDMYHELVKPIHAAAAKIGVDEGLPITMHCCGRCEDMIDDWLEYGIRFWEPAQITNNMPEIKKKYGDRLVIGGCWDSQGPPSWPGASEELIRSEVRRVIDEYAPGGGFVFVAQILAGADDKEMEQRMGWLVDEYNHYGHEFYKKH